MVVKGYKWRHSDTRERPMLTTRTGAVWRLLSVALGIFLLASCETPDSEPIEEGSIYNEVLDRGVLRVAVTTEAPPFGFIDENDEHVGFDLDIARLLAQAIFEDEEAVEFVPISFEARWETIQQGEADVGIMATTVYPDRVQQVAFAYPYIASGNAIGVTADSDMESIDDLNSPDVTVANLNIPEEEERHETFYPEARSRKFESPSAQVSAVLSGQADAFSTDLPTVQYAIRQNEGDLRLLGLTAELLNNAAFVSPSDFRWYNFIDTLFWEMRHGSLYGDYAEIYAEWFGEGNVPPQQPGAEIEVE